MFFVLTTGGLADVTVLGLVGGAPGGETPRVADSSAAKFLYLRDDATVLGQVGEPLLCDLVY